MYKYNIENYIKLPGRNNRPIKNIFALNIILWYFYITILRFYVLMSPMNNIVCRCKIIEFRELLIFPLNDKKPIFTVFNTDRKTISTAQKFILSNTHNIITLLKLFQNTQNVFNCDLHRMFNNIIRITSL